MDESINSLYRSSITEYIRRRYSIDDELAIQRKHQAGTDKGEFDEYNAYVEQCKAQAKADYNIT